MIIFEKNTEKIIKMDISEPIYFNKDHENYQLFKKIIKDQGEICCRNELDKSYINACIKNFTDGYILLSKKNVSGPTIRSNADKYILKGYCLFIYNKDLFSEVSSLITCGSKSHIGSGLQILRSVKNFINIYKIRTWTLYSLPYEKLINYYEDLGFIRGIEKLTDTGKVKVITMTQNFSYDDYEDENENICKNDCSYEDSDEDPI